MESQFHQIKLVEEHLMPVIVLFGMGFIILRHVPLLEHLLTQRRNSLSYPN
jgi:hypothetical protein